MYIATYEMPSIGSTATVPDHVLEPHTIRFLVEKKAHFPTIRLCIKVEVEVEVEASWPYHVARVECEILHRNSITRPSGSDELVRKRFDSNKIRVRVSLTARRGAARRVQIYDHRRSRTGGTGEVTVTRRVRLGKGVRRVRK